MSEVPLQVGLAGIAAGADDETHAAPAQRLHRVVLPKSILEQIRQLILHVSNSKRQVDRFVRELTFAEQFINDFVRYQVGLARITPGADDETHAEPAKSVYNVVLHKSIPARNR